MELVSQYNGCNLKYSIVYPVDVPQFIDGMQSFELVTGIPFRYGEEQVRVTANHSKSPVIMQHEILNHHKGRIQVRLPFSVRKILLEEIKIEWN